MSKQTVLVTGSSRGIGKAIALRIARDGYDVVLHCREKIEDANVVAEEIRTLGGATRVLCFDVSNRQQCADILQADMNNHGAYFGVVCNAGITRDNAFPAMSGEEWDAVIHTNLDAFYNVLNPIVMPMIHRRMPGRIVTIASVSGLFGNRGQTNYSAAKAGIIAASKTLALELAKREITVNCVAPGLIETDMVSEEIIQEAVKQIPLRRPGRPEEVAAAVSFLLSPDSAYITRQVISVNGGMI